MTAKATAPNQSDAYELGQKPQLQKNNLSFQNTERRFNIDQRYSRTKDYGPAEDKYTFAGF